MKIDSKLILEHSKNLNILYVEDDITLQNAKKKIFTNYFNHVDTANDGEAGLKSFLLFKDNNDAYYDLVISDINMPNMGGVEMSRAMINENPEQSIIFITAHDEASFLHDAIEVGIDGFLNKPIDIDQLKIVLFKITRSISDRKLINSFYKEVEDLNMKLQEQNDEINIEKAKLEEQIVLFNTQVNATNTKHQQVEQLLQQQNKESSEPLLDDNFSKDEDEGEENVLFLSDDCDELTELFDELPELMAQYSIDDDVNNMYKVIAGLKKISSILLRYTPFLDPLAKSFEEFSTTIEDNIDDFIKMYKEDPDNATMLFDAVSLDMERYIKRFSDESMAMKNIHHIHHPTTLSIKQIIGMISPENIDEGEMEFF